MPAAKWVAIESPVATRYSLLSNAAEGLEPAVWEARSSAHHVRRSIDASIEIRRGLVRAVPVCVSSRTAE